MHSNHFPRYLQFIRWHMRSMNVARHIPFTMRHMYSMHCSRYDQFITQNMNSTHFSIIFDSWCETRIQYIVHMMFKCNAKHRLDRQTHYCTVARFSNVYFPLYDLYGKSQLKMQLRLRPPGSQLISGHALCVRVCSVYCLWEPYRCGSSIREEKGTGVLHLASKHVLERSGFIDLATEIVASQQFTNLATEVNRKALRVST